MSKQANPAAIGAFVVGAIGLMVIAILVFSKAQFLAPKDRFVVFFKGSVSGLKVGAPVKLKGVQVGQVTQIQVQFNLDKAEVRTPVYLVVDLSQVDFETIDSRDISSDLTYESLIRHGLRAQLQSQSLLTGQLYVEVNFYPQSPINLVGGDVNLREIPALSSETDEIINNVGTIVSKLKALPLQELFKNLLDTSKNIQELVNSPDIMKNARKLESILDRLQNVVAKLDNRIDPMMDDVEGTMNDTRRLINNVNSQVTPVANNTRQILAQVEKSLAALDEITSPDSPIYSETSNTLNELTEAARSIRSLTDYLKRNPESLIYGKQSRTND